MANLCSRVQLIEQIFCFGHRAMWWQIRKSNFPLFGPVADSRKRLAKLEEQRAGLDETEQPDEYARINSLIEFEKNFIASISDFTKDREAKRRPAYLVSVKGMLHLLGLTIVVFIVIGVKRHYLG